MAPGGWLGAMAFTRRHTVFGGALLATLPFDAGRGWAIEPTTIEIDQGRVSLLPDDPGIRVLRYGPANPFTALRAKEGVESLWRVRNRLDTDMSIQLCGLRCLGSLNDPVNEAVTTIPAGDDALVRFTPRDAGTAWFRPRFGPDGQAARGLAGVLIVEPARPEPAFDNDIVCLMNDVLLDAAEHEGAPNGPEPTKQTSAVTVNNAPIPLKLDGRSGGRWRLRLVNGSTRRLMVVGIEGAKPTIVAVDGQPSEPFQPTRDAIPIGPGARFDIVLDLPREAGKVIRLILRGTERSGTEADRDLGVITTTGPALDGKLSLAALPPNPALPVAIPLERAKRADLVLTRSADGAWTVNGTSGRALAHAPVLKVKAGDAVTLGFSNTSNELVSLCLYGLAMRLLHAKDDGWEPYWRDTVLLPPAGRSHVAFVADTPGRWLIESGFASQAVAGLRCWFEVLAA